MKQAASARAMCATSYENDSDCFLAASSLLPAPEQSKPGACRAELGLQAVAGIEPSPAWQGGGVSWPKANST